MCKNHGWKHYALEMQHVADIFAKECNVPADLLDAARGNILRAATVIGLLDLMRHEDFLKDSTHYQLIAKIEAHREAIHQEAREIKERRSVSAGTFSDPDEETVPF